MIHLAMGNKSLALDNGATCIISAPSLFFYASRPLIYISPFHLSDTSFYSAKRYHWREEEGGEFCFI